jgi:SpoVK/Ycf46/Vps4 family AAA+-type ATPase
MKLKESKMIKGLNMVSRTFSSLLVPIAKYIITKHIQENPPKIATAGEFSRSPSLDDLQIDVYETMPAIENITAIYDDKIITAFQKYENFIVNCYAKDRIAAKEWMDHFENDMVKKNQYRGKCLYAEKESMFFKDVPKVSWDDVVLDDKVKSDIRLNTVEFLGNVKYANSGILKRGLIMYGPPGTGKTSIVKSIFNELEGKKVSRIYTTAESFRYMPMSSLFNFLAYLGPTVIGFEDVDFISGNRDIGSQSNMLGDLLTNLDGMRKFGDPLVVLASTNKMELLDSALANRPCRFDRRVSIGLPKAEHLKTMYSKHLNAEVSDEILKLSENFTGSHVVETVNTARILATSEDKTPIDCLKDACIIIRENFFPGQPTIQLKAAVQTYIIKKGYKQNIKIASKSKVQKIAEEILK